MDEIEPLPCPFCAWEKIRVIECPKDDALLKDSLYTYCWCKACGTRGPWAFNVDDNDEELYKRCVLRWNERNGVKQKHAVE